jgi:hypothetical protein
MRIHLCPLRPFGPFQLATNAQLEKKFPNWPQISANKRNYQQSALDEEQSTSPVWKDPVRKDPVWKDPLI